MNEYKWKKKQWFQGQRSSVKVWENDTKQFLFPEFYHMHPKCLVVEFTGCCDTGTDLIMTSFQLYVGNQGSQRKVCAAIKTEHTKIRIQNLKFLLL